MEDIKDYIKTYLTYPIDGIKYYDINPVYKDPIKINTVSDSVIVSGILYLLEEVFNGAPQSSIVYYDEQELIDDLHRQFVTVVSLERKLSFSKAQELADGKVFSGQQAFDNGLIDVIYVLL